MSRSIEVTHFTSRSNPQDAELFRRIAIAFASNRLVSWREIHVIVRSGLVTLWGRVPSLNNRQLVVDVARHVAGVLRVDDELTVAESSGEKVSVTSAAAAAAAAGESRPQLVVERESKLQPPWNPFENIPVLEERLDEIPQVR